MSTAAIVAMPLGLLVLVHANDRVLTLAIAVAVIAFSVLLWRGLRLPAAVAPTWPPGSPRGSCRPAPARAGPHRDRAVRQAPRTRGVPSDDLRDLPGPGSASLVFFAIGGQITRDAVSVALAGFRA